MPVAVRCSLILSGNFEIYGRDVLNQTIMDNLYNIFSTVGTNTLGQTIKLQFKTYALHPSQSPGASAGIHACMKHRVGRSRR